MHDLEVQVLVGALHLIAPTRRGGVSGGGHSAACCKRRRRAVFGGGWPELSRRRSRIKGALLRSCELGAARSCRGASLRSWELGAKLPGRVVEARGSLLSVAVREL